MTTPKPQLRALQGLYERMAEVYYHVDDAHYWAGTQLEGVLGACSSELRELELGVKKTADRDFLYHFSRFLVRVSEVLPPSDKLWRIEPHLVGTLEQLKEERDKLEARFLLEDELHG